MARSVAARTAIAEHKFNRKKFEPAFRDFISHVTINSKNKGYTLFQPYDLPWSPGNGAQEYVLDQIFTGLENDVHFFVIGKARQLGMTTLMLLFDIFWAGMYPGLQGAMVLDEDGNKEKLRELLKEILEFLPATHRLPITRENAKGIRFDHGAQGVSMLDYLVAGTKKKTGSLGRSRAYNYAHGSETAMWGDEAGFESFLSSLSDEYPFRCYVFESTGKGYNHFYSLWEDALADELTKRAIFIAWWRCPAYVVRQGTPLFNRYGYKDLGKDERETQRIVKELYNYTITPEQWAWYRHRKDPRRTENVEEVDEAKAQVVEVEYPSYPDEMFRMTGSAFLPGAALDTAQRAASKNKFQGYFYYLGKDFTAIARREAGHYKMAQLKVWEPPHPNGHYVISADPAYASDEGADRFCIQVGRCYSDRIVQVAEYCIANIEPYQFTWIIADLCGWYRNVDQLIIEINGSGEAVFTEFRQIQTLADMGRLVSPTEHEETDRSDRRRPPSIFANVRHFIYSRPDSMAGSYAWQWKMTQSNKEPLMVLFADQFMLGKLVVNSVQALEEMKKLVRSGSEISAEGKSKDDRAIALAMMVTAWIRRVQPELDGLGLTYERVQQQDAALGDGGDVGFMAYIMQQRGEERARRERDSRMTRNRNWNW